MRVWRHTTIVLLSVTLMLWGSALASAQETASGDHVQVRWLAPDSLAAGEATTIGFYFEVDPQWHVYWHNAGDSGAPPRFDITAEGADVGPLQWPFPKRLPIEHLTNFGYEGSVAYLFTLTPEPGTETVSLTVELEWLVCKVDCIPGFGSMSVERPVAVSSRWDERDRAIVERFAARVPLSAKASPWQVAGLVADEHTLRLSLSGEGKVPTIFPTDGALITAADPVVQRGDEHLELLFERNPGAPLTATTGFVVSDGERAWALENIPVAAAPVAPPAESRALWLLLLAAFAGGVILNLMPCVFPVLSIKLFSLINHPAESGSRGRLREGLLYSAGVLVTFAALGAALLALRAGGAAIGWGFQLQSAPVVLVLIVLFWLMALAFSGVFEFGHRLMSWAGNARGGSFTTGVLAVFVAAPCTGPFMGAALGAAAVLPATAAMAIFLGLGAGLAAPFLLLTASPALLRHLPAPGPWMITLRQAMAFPLYATVIWLLWVLGRLVGDGGWLWGSALLLVLAFALWLGQTLRRGGKLLGLSVAVLALVFTFAALGRIQPASTETASPAGLWQPYNHEVIASARAEQRPVFIDFTAAWCITCQVNKARVLDTAVVTKLFRDREVLAIRADWTRHNPVITEALAELGRNSVPVYAWYPPGAAEHELLPQLLSERMITDLFTPQTTTEITP